MSIKSKIAAIAAASIGIVATQSSSLHADNNAHENSTKIKAPVDWGEEVLFSALADEALEKAAEVGGFGACGATQAASSCGLVACLGSQGSSQPVNKRPPSVSKSPASTSKPKVLPK